MGDPSEFVPLPEDKRIAVTKDGTLLIMFVTRKDVTKVNTMGGIQCEMSLGPEKKYSHSVDFRVLGNGRCSSCKGAMSWIVYTVVRICSFDLLTNSPNCLEISQENLYVDTLGLKGLNSKVRHPLFVQVFSSLNFLSIVHFWLKSPFCSFWFIPNSPSKKMTIIHQGIKLI